MHQFRQQCPATLDETPPVKVRHTSEFRRFDLSACFSSTWRVTAERWWPSGEVSELLPLDEVLERGTLGETFDLGHDVIGESLSFVA